ncbi:MAG: preprotein translocase subunit YajC [Candidatus Epulonipiscioides saccharophilum]|nr:MAG: preprotein translocase subunit YajC [Epulopiscium sp. AS2M-Bin001]
MEQAVTPTAGTGLFGSIIYIAFIFGLMWLIMVRPQRKRERATAQMQSEIKVGQPVLLTSGIYGKVVDVINDLFIIEIGLNKSVRVPVKKSQVAGVEAPNLKIVKDSAPVIDNTSANEVDEEEYDDED